ncbi:MAG: zinc ribbon domain-containing protein [Anaerolineae bacterium]|nr:zinc ribbon domain-containing protein [Anaerolineae bacterium]
MPVYTYQCEECGVRFDAKQRFSDDPITVCPECGGQTHKVIQPVGVVFKGSGFYVTDNRSKRSGLTGSGKDTSEKAESKSSDTAASKDTSTTKSTAKAKTDD